MKIKNRKELKKGSTYRTYPCCSRALLDKAGIQKPVVFLKVSVEGKVSLYEAEYIDMRYVLGEKIRDLKSQNSSRHGYVWVSFPLTLKEA